MTDVPEYITRQYFHSPIINMIQLKKIRSIEQAILQRQCRQIQEATVVQRKVGFLADFGGR